MRTTFSADPAASALPLPGLAAPRPEPAGPPPALSVTTFGLTDRGRQRSTNEDRFLIASPASALWLDREGRHSGEFGYGEIQGEVFAVADGIGGRAGGGVASALAIETMSTFLMSTLQWVFALGGPEAVGAEMLEQIKVVLHWADSRVRDEAARSSGFDDMGTTLTMAYRYGRFLYVGHVGDSRCYLLRDGRLHRITRDHTVAAELLQHGILTEEVAAHHIARHVITNAVGPMTTVLRPEVHRLRLHAGDTLILCTDGLTGVVTEAEIVSILEAADSPGDACEQLVERANQLGGPDNVTVVVAGFDAASAADRPPRARRPSQA
jgi:serine/threonine protein phosphatase PrpC